MTIECPTEKDAFCLQVACAVTSGIEINVGEVWECMMWSGVLHAAPTHCAACTAHIHGAPHMRSAPGCRARERGRCSCASHTSPLSCCTQSHGMPLWWVNVLGASNKSCLLSHYLQGAVCLFAFGRAEDCSAGRCRQKALSCFQDKCHITSLSLRVELHGGRPVCSCYLKGQCAVHPGGSVHSVQGGHGGGLQQTGMTEPRPAALRSI